MKSETTSTPFWQQKTFWASVVAGMLALPSVVDEIGALLPPHVKAKAMAWAAVAAALAAIYARKGGVTAANKVEAEVTSLPAPKIR